MPFVMPPPHPPPHPTPTPPPTPTTPHPPPPPIWGEFVVKIHCTITKCNISTVHCIIIEIKGHVTLAVYIVTTILGLFFMPSRSIHPQVPNFQMNCRGYMTESQKSIPSNGYQRASHIQEIEPCHKSHNALHKYPTMHHSGTEIREHFCYKMVHCGIFV